MLRFFRQIRQRLLTDNKFSKYLLYAVGEIMLVVIGILIALQVDNWNENRIATENTKVLFQEVREELVENIINIDRIIDQILFKETGYFKVLGKKVSYEDYRTSGDLFSFPYWWDTANLVDEDFKELLARKSNLTKLQDSIFSELKELYGVRKINTDNDDVLIEETQLSLRRISMEKFPWWSSFHFDGIVTDEMIDLALNDPFYLNLVSESMVVNQIQFNGLFWFRTKAFDLYEELSEMLNLEKDSTLVQDLKKFEHVRGVYEALDNVNGLFESGDALHLQGENKLQFHRYKNDSLMGKYEIQPYSNSYLILYFPESRYVESSVLYKVERGENEEVLGLSQLWRFEEKNGNRLVLQKIE